MSSERDVSEIIVRNRAYTSRTLKVCKCFLCTGCSNNSVTLVERTWDVPVAQPFLPKSPLPKHNQTDSVTAKIKVNPAMVSDLKEHPVDSSYSFQAVRKPSCSIPHRRKTSLTTSSATAWRGVASLPSSRRPPCPPSL